LWNPALKIFALETRNYFKVIGRLQVVGVRFDNLRFGAVCRSADGWGAVRQRPVVPMFPPTHA
jgi:hypothetical protein